MKNYKLFASILSIFIILNLESCSQQHNYDSDLMKPDGYGGGYNLTELGCLINGPWNLFNYPNAGYNSELFLKDSLIWSNGFPFDKLKKELIFELHKNGTIVYLFKSENGIIDTLRKNQMRVVIRQPYEQDNWKKKYTNGYWKANFKDSTILIHFNERNIPELNFKYSTLGNGHANFQEITFIDSVYNGSKVKFKKVNTLYYETLFPRF